jgi:hypothetical protein
MSTICALPGCSVQPQKPLYKDKNYSLFALPNPTKYLEAHSKWRQILLKYRSDKKFLESLALKPCPLRVCSRHFKESDFMTVSRDTTGGTVDYLTTIILLPLPLLLLPSPLLFLTILLHL